MKILLLIFLTLFFSCSLNYTKSENSEDSVPEFVFKNASYTKVENSSNKMQLNAEKLEQYKTDGSIFAQNISFQTFDKDGKTSSSGKCNLLSSQENDQLFLLSGNINLSFSTDYYNK